MARRFLLVAALVVVLSECQQRGSFCLSSQRRMVRLTNGSSYAGIVEMCWQEVSSEQYKWLPVCSEGWTSSLASQVCKELSISTTTPLDIQAASFGERQSRFGDAVILKCDNVQSCSLQTVDITHCYYDSLAVVICDLPTQTPSAETSTTACTSSDSAAAATPSPLDCRECSVLATSSPSGQSNCTVLAGVLGSVIAIVVVLLVGMLVGCVWSCRHHKQNVHYIDSSSESKVETAAVRPHIHIDNGGHDNNYATISEHVHRVSPATLSPSPSPNPVMYDTIEDRAPPAATTGGGGGGGRGRAGEHHYHELDGYTTNNSGRETSTDNGERNANSALSDEQNQQGQSGSYYEVPIKSTLNK